MDVAMDVALAGCLFVSGFYFIILGGRLVASSLTHNCAADCANEGFYAALLASENEGSTYILDGEGHIRRRSARKAAKESATPSAAS